MGSKRPRSLPMSRSCAMGGPPARVQAALAELYLSRRDPQRARTLARAAFERMPWDAQVVSVYARVLREAGATKEGLALLRAGGADRTRRRRNRLSSGRGPGRRWAFRAGRGRAGTDPARSSGCAPGCGSPRPKRAPSPLACSCERYRRRRRRHPGVRHVLPAPPGARP
jgi:hypothetical protein